MQQVYAVLFSGAITMGVAAFILYSDYGFWRETYNRNDIVEGKKTVKETVVDVQSPGDMMGDFLREAKAKVKTINVSSSNILQGKDVYNKEK